MKQKLTLLFVCILLSCGVEMLSASSSVYKQRPQDPDALYLVPQKGDMTQLIQDSINALKLRDNYGIVFFAPGEYRISGTIHVPPSIRLIGYGEKRPTIILSKNSPGYGQPHLDDEGDAKYMLWFVANTVTNGVAPAEATSGTFFQGLSNINIRIERGNPYAVAFRTHYAQHSFIEHAELEIGQGKAGIFEVGNEIEDVVIRGGDYGIYTRKTSPGWQFTAINCLIEGQRKACIRTMEAGMTLIRVTMRKAPIGLEIWPENTETAYLEDCTLEQLTTAGIMQSGIHTPTNQCGAQRLVCRGVPVLFRHQAHDETVVRAPAQIYQVDSLSMGIHFDSMEADGIYDFRYHLTPLKEMPEAPHDDIPDLPDMAEWTNILDLGAVGDGETDCTEILQKAIDSHQTVYLPQGIYIVSRTIYLRPHTVLIGLDPVSTRIKVKEGTPAFSHFGTPVPVIETALGGNCIFSGIGIDMMGFNYRAVSCKWMAGPDSYLNDVHFSGWATMKGPQKFGGFSQEMSNLFRRPRIVDKGVEESWDNQHWNLWVTNQGGGTFKNIWINNTYGSCGLFVENTQTPGRIYEMSVEHHLRSEVRFDQVSHWRLYALQLEEETREGNDVIPMELNACQDLHFFNFYAFRVISIVRPLPYVVRTWNCSDIHFHNFHNFTQMRFTIDNAVYDPNKQLTVRPWEFARLTITGQEKGLPHEKDETDVEILQRGFEYAEGLTADSKGNVYFTEERLRKLYRWDGANHRLNLLLDLPWQPLSLATDTKDHLLVVVKYYPQPQPQPAGQRGRFSMPKSWPKPYQMPDHKGTTYSWWGNYGFYPRVYALHPDQPTASLQTLEPLPAASVTGNPTRVYYATHRWRDLHDFDEACAYRPDSVFIAPDGQTLIPYQYDLLRSSSLQSSSPGQTICQVDEFAHRVKRFQVDQTGYLHSPSLVAERGEHGVTTDNQGRIYVAEGHILVYDQEGNFLRTIHTPAGPNSLVVAGDYLYFTTRHMLCRIDLSKLF